MVEGFKRILQGVYEAFCIRFLGLRIYASESKIQSLTSCAVVLPGVDTPAKIISLLQRSES